MLPYQNPALTIEARVRDLLSRMTVEEKIGQLVKLDGFRSYERNESGYCLTPEFKELTARYPIGSMYGLLRADWWTEKDWNSGVPPDRMPEVVNQFQHYILSHSRLGIPIYLAEEAPHGLMVLGSTVFPTGLGLGAACDAGLLNRIGRVIGAEAHATGIQAVYGPILDIARDPRWSRVEESFSEDAFLVSVCGREMVRGIVAEGVISTLKHYVAHGSSEGGHNMASCHLGMVELRNCQLRPFREAIHAGAQSVMSAYSDVDGLPSTGSRRLLTDILRNELGFDGFVVSDRGAIPLLHRNRLVADDAEASAMAIKSGCDVDEACEQHFNGLLKAFHRGLIDQADLDRAAGRILRLKFEKGLFENPYRIDKPIDIFRNSKHLKIALEASRKAICLLKNEQHFLPLKSLGALAVIGPNADSPMNQLGDYSAPQRPGDVVTVLDGIRRVAEPEGIVIGYARGCGIRSLDRSGFAAAVELAKKSDAVVLVLGGCSTKYGSEMVRTATGAAMPAILSPEQSEKESGEGTDRSELRISGVQLELLQVLSETGKPIVVVLVQGRPLLLNKLAEKAVAVLLAWYPGMLGGQAIAEVLFGKYNPAGRLPISIPLGEGQLPVFYNPLSCRGNYVDGSAMPYLPFGFGLSFTTFAYRNLRVNGRTASVAVRNTGAMDGEEVVQFYLTSLKSSVMRPIRELCAFERIFLKAGEERMVDAMLTDDVLGYYDENGAFTVESGPLRLTVGGSSEVDEGIEFRLDSDQLTN